MARRAGRGRRCAGSVARPWTQRCGLQPGLGRLIHQALDKAGIRNGLVTIPGASMAGVLTREMTNARRDSSLSRRTNIVQGKCKEFKRSTRQPRLHRWEASGLSCSRRSRPIYSFERHEALTGTGRASRPVRQNRLHPTGRGPATCILTRAETLGSLGGEL